MKQQIQFWCLFLENTLLRHCTFYCPYLHYLANNWLFIPSKLWQLDELQKKGAFKQPFTCSTCVHFLEPALVVIVGYTWLRRGLSPVEEQRLSKCSSCQTLIYCSKSCKLWCRPGLLCKLYFLEGRAVIFHFSFMKYFPRQFRSNQHCTVRGMVAALLH